jgi:ATP-dependent Clp protease ATP-binding subunit ClpA
VSGGRVGVDLDEKDQIKLEFSEGDAPPPVASQEVVEVE